MDVVMVHGEVVETGEVEEVWEDNQGLEETVIKAEKKTIMMMS